MKIYGLVGYPLGHSFSAGFFTDKFATLGLTGEYEYRNFAVESVDRLRELLPPEICGFNITIPHKQNILPLLSQLDDEAGQVGAVNCVKILEDGAFKGYNTDIYGFEMSLREMFRTTNPSFAGEALVLGTGGAAQAVHYVLSKLGIAYTQVSRHSGPDRLSYEELTPGIIREHRLLINTTPLGMSPHTEEAPPIPYEAVGREHYLYDLIYNPAQTLFLRQGRVRGAWVKSGLQMLVLQAEKSWEIWNT